MTEEEKRAKRRDYNREYMRKKRSEGTSWDKLNPEKAKQSKNSSSKRTTHRYTMTLIKSTQSDMIEHMDKQENVNQYLQNLVRQDMYKPE